MRSRVIKICYLAMMHPIIRESVLTIYSFVSKTFIFVTFRHFCVIYPFDGD